MKRWERGDGGEEAMETVGELFCGGWLVDCGAQRKSREKGREYRRT